MIDDDEFRDEEAPPRAKDLERRFLLTAAGWLVVFGLFYALGYVSLAFAIVAVAAGGGSALGFALYWRSRGRGERLSR